MEITNELYSLRGTASETTQQLYGIWDWFRYEHYMRRSTLYGNEGTDFFMQHHSQMLALRVALHLLSQSFCEDLGLQFHPSRAQDGSYMYLVQVRTGWQLYVHPELEEE